MDLNKLIGFVLDTNQWTSQKIDTKEYAKFAIRKVIELYGENILQHMYLSGDRYTTFAAKNEFTLEKLLKNK